MSELSHTKVIPPIQSNFGAQTVYTPLIHLAQSILNTLHTLRELKIRAESSGIKPRDIEHDPFREEAQLCDYSCVLAE